MVGIVHKALKREPIHELGLRIIFSSVTSV